MRSPSADPNGGISASCRAGAIADRKSSRRNCCTSGKLFDKGRFGMFFALFIFGEVFPRWWERWPNRFNGGWAELSSLTSDSMRSTYIYRGHRRIFASVSYTLSKATNTSEPDGNGIGPNQSIISRLGDEERGQAWWISGIGLS